MSKTHLLRGLGAVLLSTAAAVAMAQGSPSGAKTSDAGDRGSGNMTGTSSNADTSASGVRGTHKDKSMKDGKHSTDKKTGAQSPAQGKGNSEQNTPVTNKPSTQP
jgi:hypothetical protein